MFHFVLCIVPLGLSHTYYTGWNISNGHCIMIMQGCSSKPCSCYASIPRLLTFCLIFLLVRPPIVAGAQLAPRSKTLSSPLRGSTGTQALSSTGPPSFCYNELHFRVTGLLESPGALVSSLSITHFSSEAFAFFMLHHIRHLHFSNTTLYPVSLDSHLR